MEIINICDLHNLSQQNEGRNLISMLQGFGVIPASFPCPRIDDQFRWKCDQYMELLRKKTSAVQWKTINQNNQTQSFQFANMHVCKSLGGKCFLEIDWTTMSNPECSIADRLVIILP